VNGFNESVADRMAVAEVKKRMQDLVDDAVEHFAHEERLFKEWRYPHADEHARMHAQLQEEGIEAFIGMPPSEAAH